MGRRACRPAPPSRPGLSRQSPQSSSRSTDRRLSIRLARRPRCCPLPRQLRSRRPFGRARHASASTPRFVPPLDGVPLCVRSQSLFVPLLRAFLFPRFQLLLSSHALPRPALLSPALICFRPVFHPSQRRASHAARRRRSFLLISFEHAHILAGAAEYKLAERPAPRARCSPLAARSLRVPPFCSRLASSVPPCATFRSASSVADALALLLSRPLSPTTFRRSPERVARARQTRWHVAVPFRARLLLDRTRSRSSAPAYFPFSFRPALSSTPSLPPRRPRFV